MSATPLTGAIIGTDHYHADLIAGALLQNPESLTVKHLLTSGALARTLAAKYKKRIPYIRPRTDRTIEAVLKGDTDIVFLFVQNFEKPGLASRLLASGKKVVADKPVAICRPGLEQIEQAHARYAGKGPDRDLALSVLFTSGFSPVRQAVKQWLTEGRIGKLRYIEQSSHNLLDKGHPRSPDMFRDANYGGVLTDMCTHSIDFILSLFKRWDYTVEDAMLSGHCPAPAFINRITRTKNRHSAGMYFYDAGSVFFRIQGVRCQVSSTWLMPGEAPYEDGRTAFYGTAGDLIIGRVRGKSAVSWTPYQDRTVAGITYRKAKTVELKAAPGTGYGYGQFLQAYIEAVTRRRPDTRLPAFDRIVAGARLLLEANARARQGNRRRVPGGIRGSI